MQHQQQRGSFSGNRFHFRLQVKLKFSLRALISYKVDLLLKICHTHRHTHSLCCMPQSTSGSKLKQVNRICQGAIMIVWQEVGFSLLPASCSIAPAQLQSSSCLRPSPLSTPLSSCVLMAHNVTHMPQSRVESSPQCHSQA